MGTGKVQKEKDSGLLELAQGWWADWTVPSNSARSSVGKSDAGPAADAYAQAPDSLSLNKILETTGVTTAGRANFFKEGSDHTSKTAAEKNPQANPDDLLSRDRLLHFAQSYEKQADQSDNFQEKWRLLCIAEQDYQLAGDLSGLSRVLEKQLFAAQDEGCEHLALEIESRLSALEGDYDFALVLQENLEVKVSTFNNKPTEIKEIKQKKTELHQAYALQLAEEGDVEAGYEQMKAALAEEPTKGNAQSVLAYYKLSGLGDLENLEQEIRVCETEAYSCDPQIADPAKLKLLALYRKQKAIRREVEVILDMAYGEPEYALEAEDPISDALNKGRFEHEMARAGAYAMLGDPGRANWVYGALFEEIKASGAEVIPEAEWQVQTSATLAALDSVDGLAEAQRGDLYRLDPNLSLEPVSDLQLPQSEEAWFIFFEKEEARVRAMLGEGFLEETQRVIEQSQNALEASSLSEDLKTEYRRQLKAQLNFVELQIDEVMEDAFVHSSEDGMRLKTEEEQRRYACRLAEAGLIEAARKMLSSLKTDYDDRNYRRINPYYFRQLNALARARVALALDHSDPLKVFEHDAFQTLGFAEEELKHRGDLQNEFFENRWVYAEFASKVGYAESSRREDERLLAAHAKLTDGDTKNPALLMARLRLAKNLLKLGGEAKEIQNHLGLVLDRSDGNPHLVSAAVDLLAELELREGNTPSWYALKARIEIDYPQSEAARRIALDPRFKKLRDADGKLDPARAPEAHDYDGAAWVAFVESGNIHPAEHTAWAIGGGAAGLMWDRVRASAAARLAGAARGAQIGAEGGGWGVLGGVLLGLVLSGGSGVVQNSDKIANARRYGVSNVDSDAVVRRILMGGSDVVIGVSAGLVAPAVGNAARNTVGFYSEELLTLIRPKVSQATFRALTQVNQGMLHVTGGLASTAAMTTWSGAMGWAMTGENHLFTREHTHDTLMLYSLIETFALVKSRGRGSRYAVSPRFQSGVTAEVHLNGEVVGRSNLSGRLSGWALDVGIAGSAHFYLTTLNNAIIGEATPKTFGELIRAQAAEVRGHYGTLGPLHYGTRLATQNWGAYRVHLGLGELEYRARLKRLDDMIKNPPDDWGGPPGMGPRMAYAASYPFGPLATEDPLASSSIPELWMASLGDASSGGSKASSDLDQFSEDARDIARDHEFLENDASVRVIEEQLILDAAVRLGQNKELARIDVLDSEGRRIAVMENITYRLYDIHGQRIFSVTTEAEARALEDYRRVQQAEALAKSPSSDTTAEPFEFHRRGEAAAAKAAVEGGGELLIEGVEIAEHFSNKDGEGGAYVKKIVLSKNGHSEPVIIVGQQQEQVDLAAQKVLAESRHPQRSIENILQDTADWAKDHGYSLSVAALYPTNHGTPTVAVTQVGSVQWVFVPQVEEHPDNVLFHGHPIFPVFYSKPRVRTFDMSPGGRLFLVSENFNGDLKHPHGDLPSTSSTSGIQDFTDRLGSHLAKAESLNGKQLGVVGIEFGDVKFPKNESGLEAKKAVLEKYQHLLTRLEQEKIIDEKPSERRMTFNLLPIESRVDIILMILELLPYVDQTSPFDRKSLLQSIGLTNRQSDYFNRWAEAYYEAMDAQKSPREAIIGIENERLKGLQTSLQENAISAEESSEGIVRNRPFILGPYEIRRTKIAQTIELLGPASERRRRSVRDAMLGEARVEARRTNAYFTELLKKIGIEEEQDLKVSRGNFYRASIEDRVEIILTAVALSQYSGGGGSIIRQAIRPNIAYRLGFGSVDLLMRWIDLYQETFESMDEAVRNNPVEAERLIVETFFEFEANRIMRNSEPVMKAAPKPKPKSKPRPISRFNVNSKPKPPPVSQVPPPPPTAGDLEAMVVWHVALRRLFRAQFRLANGGDIDQFNTTDFLLLSGYVIYPENPAAARALTLQDLKNFTDNNLSPEFEALREAYGADKPHIRRMISAAEKKQKAEAKKR